MSGHPGTMRDLGYTPLNRLLADYERESLTQQAAIFRDAIKGDVMARFAAQRILGLCGWWSREHGNVIGDLASVVAELEQRGMVPLS